ncbi:MAG: hypothetical protein EOP04_18665 [Proteobacteria bacterium]|nr:MAG: hypothetical protein EOP04_18665 [Pseudomonadota bacterium]
MKNTRLLSVVINNYDTYADRQGVAENHIIRIISQLFLAVTLSLSIIKLSDDNIAVLVTATSILMGFAFSALFPVAYDNGSSLPAPIYSEDFDDIKEIKLLTTFFRHNVAYFVPAALVCIAMLMLQMMTISISPRITIGIDTFCHFVISRRVDWDFAALFLHKTTIAASIFLIIECSYTFYRMCFNVLALLRIRDEYVSDRAKREGPADL